MKENKMHICIGIELFSGEKDSRRSNLNNIDKRINMLVPKKIT